MNFKMNVVVCAMTLMISQCGHAVYNWDWVKGKPVRHDRRGVIELLRSADRLPGEHYGELMAMLLSLPKEDRRESARLVSAVTARATGTMPTCSTARPPIAPYGDLTATLVGLPAVDTRDISFEPVRPVTAHVVRKNGPIPSCSSARQPCIVVNGAIVYRVDEMVETARQAGAISPKKSR